MWAIKCDYPLSATKRKEKKKTNPKPPSLPIPHFTTVPPSPSHPPFFFSLLRQFFFFSN